MKLKYTFECGARPAGSASIKYNLFGMEMHITILISVVGLIPRLMNRTYSTVCRT